MASAVDVDVIWRALGKFKRYTLQQIIYNYFICVFLIGFPMLVYVFVGYTPPHRCKEFSKDLSLYGFAADNNTRYEVVSYEKCHTVISKNTSNITDVFHVPCLEGYFYDTEQETFVTEWNLVCDKAGLGELTQTMLTAGQIVGALVFPSLSDRYGRKPVSITAMLTVTTLSIVASFGNYYLHVVMKFLIGTFHQGIGLTMAVYIVEQVPKEDRGFVSSLGSFAWALQVIIVACIGYLMRNVNWRYVQMVSGLNGVHTIATFWILDESLRWLIANGKMKRAKKMVEKVARVNKVNLEDVLPLMEVENEMSLLKEPDVIKNVSKEKQKHDKENILTILRHKRLLKTSAIMFFTWMTNALVYFGLILTSNQLAGDRYLNFIINCAVEMPAVICFMLVVKRLTRKQISILFHSVSGVSLIISVILKTLKDRGSGFETASVIFSFIGKFGITGSFSLLFLFTPELYPTNLRNIGIGLASMSARVGGMFAPYFSLLATYVEWGPGVIFGACCGIATVLQFLLPETSMMELPQSVRELREWDKLRKNKKIGNEK